MRFYFAIPLYGHKAIIPGSGQRRRSASARPPTPRPTAWDTEPVGDAGGPSKTCLRAQPRRRRRLHNGVRCAPTGCSLHHVTERMLLGCGRSVGPRHASRSENETPNCESITSPTSAPVAHTDPPSIHRSSAGRHFFHGVLQSYSASTQTRTGGVLWAVPSAAV